MEKAVKMYGCISDAVASKFERVKYMGEICNPYGIILKLNVKFNSCFVTETVYVEIHVPQSSFFQQHSKFI